MHSREELKKLRATGDEVVKKGRQRLDFKKWYLAFYCRKHYIHEIAWSIKIHRNAILSYDKTLILAKAFPNLLNQLKVQEDVIELYITFCQV